MPSIAVSLCCVAWSVMILSNAVSLCCVAMPFIAMPSIAVSLGSGEGSLVTGTNEHPYTPALWWVHLCSFVLFMSLSMLFYSFCLLACPYCCLSAWLSAWLSVCLPAYLLDCLSAWLSTWLSACLAVCLIVWLSAWLSVYLAVCMWTLETPLVFHLVSII